MAKKFDPTAKYKINNITIINVYLQSNDIAGSMGEGETTVSRNLKPVVNNKKVSSVFWSILDTLTSNV